MARNTDANGDQYHRRHAGVPPPHHRIMTSAPGLSRELASRAGFKTSIKTAVTGGTGLGAPLLSARGPSRRLQARYASRGPPGPPGACCDRIDRLPDRRSC